MEIKCCNQFRSLEAALFCPQCSAARCEYCTVWEPVAWFCRQCLAESTKLAAHSSFNQCSRNCVACPHCNAPLVKTKEQGVVYACPACDFSFRFNDPKSTGLSLCKQTQLLRGKQFREVASFVAKHLPPEAPLVEAQLEAELEAQMESLLNAAQNEDEDEDDDKPQLAPEPTAPKPPTVLKPKDVCLPVCMPLRAKFNKLCGRCGFVLVEADRQVKSALCISRQALRLPRLEIYKTTEGTYKLVAWAPTVPLMAKPLMDFGEVGVHSEISSADLRIPAPLPDSETGSGFPYPLFLVDRESTASRQAFMKGQKNSTAGPGWAMSELGSDDAVESTTWICEFEGRRYEVKIKVQRL